MKWRRPNAGKFNVPIASGLIAGEALASALIAITCTIIGLMLHQAAGR
jgi:hypothetical protein